jgi:uncharacterized membrane protein
MNPFTKHPKEVGLNYLSHFIFALSVVGQLLFALIACFIHAFFPFLFTHTTSGIIKKLHSKIDHRTAR